MTEIIEKLYETFRPYRLGTTIDGCNHCVSAGMSGELMATPLRKLTAEQLSQFSLKAMTTWGTEQDFKHFLPRLLELAFLDPSELDWLETLFGKLTLANWQEWPAAERRLMADYLAELWRVTLARPREYENDDSADSVLCAIGSTEVDLQPFLARWHDDRSQAALDHLCVFIQNNYEPMRKNPPRLCNAFWTFGSPAQLTVINWLQSDGVLDRIHQDQNLIATELFDAIWQLEAIVDDRQKTNR